MKQLLLIFVLSTFIANSQTFAPFNQNVPKRFFEVEEPEMDDYYFYSYQTDVSGDISTFHQYSRRIEFEVPIGDSCTGWGADMGLAGDTTWLGRDIIYNAAIRTLRLKNSLDNLLTFDFSIAYGDSAVFFTTPESEYYIKYNEVSLESVYGTEDLVKTFVILHYNLAGEAIDSPLHNFEIELGESLGLLSFIDCHNFPESQVGLSLMGQLHPTIGKYQMTYDEAFPWESGDLLQYRSVLYNYEFDASNTTYNTITVTDRTETLDSVFISLSSSSFTVYSPSDDIYPFTYNFDYGSTIAYKKGENISEAPSGMMPYLDHIQFTDSTEYCGEREKLRFSPDFLGFCEDCHCDIPYDGFGTTFYNKTYLTGLGNTSISSETYGDLFSGTNASLIYSNIDGEICGTQAFASLYTEKNDFTIYPNPVQDVLNVVLGSPVDIVRVINLNGEIISTQPVIGLNFEISLANLPEGIYVLELQSGSTRTFKRFVKS